MSEYKHKLSLFWRMEMVSAGRSEGSSSKAKKLDTFLDKYENKLLDTDLKEVYGDLNELYEHVENVSDKYKKRKSENIFYRAISEFLSSGFATISTAYEGVEELQEKAKK